MTQIREDGCKCCTKCNEWKSAVDQFYLKENGKFTGACKACTRAQAKKWAEDNSEHKKAADAARHKAINTKKRLEREAKREADRLAGIVHPHHNLGRRFEPQNPGFPDGVIVDPDVLETLGKYSWHASSNGYIQRHGYKENGKRTAIRLHREIMGFPDGEVDHLNGNKMDCRRENMRVVDRRTNTQNMSLGGYGVSGFLGVCPQGKKWKAYATLNYNQFTLGIYDDIHEAAEVARKFREEHYDGFIGRSE